jgi:hypothetical protein
MHWSGRARIGSAGLDAVGLAAPGMESFAGALVYRGPDVRSEFHEVKRVSTSLDTDESARRAAS